MASFTSSPRQFNPYVAQIPIDVYSSVGLQRQMAYNAGVQQVNTQLQGIAGIELLRDTDRQYLQGRLQDITSKVNSVASADWSAPALIGQVNHLATLIHGDGNIRQAMVSGQKYLRDENSISEAKKNGKWAPENEWILRSQMNNWLADPSPGAQYSTNGYKPFEDVASDVISAWKQARPDVTLSQRPNGDFYAFEKVNGEVVGKDGKTIIQTQIRELRPDEIASQINALLTPSQREQLAISGLYYYRHMAQPHLGELINKHFKEGESYFDGLLSQEKLQLSLNAGKPGAIAQINERIAQLEKSKKEIETNKAGYREMAATNPDGLKSAVYYESWLNGISAMIGYREQSSKIVDNPAYKVQLDEFKIWADLQKAMRAHEAKNSGRKGSGSSSEDDGEVNPTSGTVLPISETQRQGVTLESFRHELLQIKDQRDQVAANLLYRHFGDRFVNRVVKDLNGDGIAEQVTVVKPGMEKEATLTMASWWDSYRKGDPNLDITIRETLKELDDQRLVANRLAEVVTGIDSTVDAQLKSRPQYINAQAEMQQFRQMPSVTINETEITPSDVGHYHEMVQAKLITGGSGGTGMPGGAYMPHLSDQDLAGYGLSRDKYNILHNGSDGDKVAREHINAMRRAYANVSRSTADIEKSRVQLANEQAARYRGIFNEVMITLPSSKPAEYRPIANLVQTLAANARETEMGGHTNWSRVREMIGEEHAAATVYSYVQDRNGNIRLRLSNADIDKGSPQEIVVDSQTARINNLYTPDYLATTRSMLDLGENIRTGSTFEQSIPTNNARTGRYTVRHQVENFGGRFKLTLYVTDSQADDKQPVTLPINSTLFGNWNDLSNFLQSDLNEKFISSLLHKEAPASSSPAAANPFINNFLINQASITGTK